MTQVRIAMPALFGSLFFLLIPLYDILLQQSVVSLPLFSVISLLCLLLAIISAVFAAKKIAYINHDIKLAIEKNETIFLPYPLKGMVNSMFFISILSFVSFIFMKIVILTDITYFFQTIFGSFPSLLFAILFYCIFFWSTYIIIKHHLLDKNHDKYVSFRGKQILQMKSVH